MSTTTATDVQELTRRSQEQFLDAVRESQKAIVDAVSAWSQTVQGYTSNAPTMPGSDQLPSADSVIDNTFDLVEKLVAGQRDFAHRLVAAAAPAAQGAADAAERTASQASSKK
jgi:hypothetical protein